MSDLAKLFALACCGCIYSVCDASDQQATQDPDCGAMEQAEGNPEYNRLVCEGLRQMERGHFAEATQTFEAAMKIPLFEFPNFALFSRLALAYLRAGDNTAARDALKKAELSLSVLIGATRCEETEKGFRLIKRGDIAVSANQDKEVTRRMCGAAYEYIYAHMHNAPLGVC